MLAVTAVLCPTCGIEAAEEANFCHSCGTGLPNAPSTQSSWTSSMPLPMAYGAIWRRFIASILDAVLVTAAVSVVAIAFTWTMELAAPSLGIDPEDSRFVCGIFAVLLWIIVNWLYNARMQSSPLQATLGKRFMGLQVTGLLGERISFAQATVRHFTKYLSAFIAFAGFGIALLTKRKQALHDIVAGTLILRR